MRRAALAALILAAASGCGTVRHVAGPNERYGEPHLDIYGGVAEDLAQIKTGEPDGLPRFLHTSVFAADLPLSLVADTVLLPVTVPASVYRSINAYYFPLDTSGDEWRKFWFNDTEPQPDPTPPAPSPAP